ncbi:alpha/beta hydrolase family protein [Sphingomonas quercus]|uniref:Alpha/beta hydrolase n=1 Tax=Sphingomonas quercus TaxID=2842451 RepID=A0ABS6BLI7_9SPHN|nr:alpha/beta hydrolase [Sphingomonas quercus]MBU3078114.1 alpha/beta hydrolase [Sphingomonas quercus]
MRRILPILALLAVPAGAQTLPDALTRDPPAVAGHPARLEQIRYPTGGLEVPARLFVAGGAGTHPTMLLLHGFPGTELNLDLARVFQRAGWNVMAVHYRGVWGGPGQFSFGHVVEDAHAALAWLRSPAAAAHGIDPKRIVVLGHSMGGFATVMLGDDRAVAGYVLISAANMGRSALALADNPGRRGGFADDAGYTNASIDSLIADARAHAADWDWDRRAALMAGRPVLVLTSDDGLAPTGEAAARAIAAAGGPKPETVHMTTDHSYNDHRIALAATILRWLEKSFPAP